MTTSIYVLASRENKNNTREYTSWLVKNMTMLSEVKKHRFVLRVNILPLIFRRRDSIAIIYDISHDFFPETYSRFRRNYSRFITKCALCLAQKIIVPSESAKKDILKFYSPNKRINPEKIFVIYENAGSKLCHEKAFDFFQREKSYSVSVLARPVQAPNIFLGYNSDTANSSITPYFLYVGQLELKKNILGIFRAFDLFKAQYKSPYKLVLAGELGFGSKKIKEAAVKCNFKNDIILIDSLNEEKIDNLFRNADIFFYPSFYESSSKTILGAQSYDLPIITSCISSMPEIAGEGAVLVNPHDIEDMKGAMIRVVSDEDLRRNLIQKGHENLKRFRGNYLSDEFLRL